MQQRTRLLACQHWRCRTTLSRSGTGLGTPSAIARDQISGKIYISNSCNNSITVYASGSAGNATPIATIIGSNTNISNPTGLALDSTGNIYVANTGSNAITVYPAGSSGNVAPSATISGTNTQLNVPQAIALDSKGNIYAANNGTSIVTVYAPDSNGNVAPSSVIGGYETGLSAPVGIALDSNGKIYVVNNSNGDFSVTVYPSGSKGDVTPAATISGTTTELVSSAAIAVDSMGKIYVTNEQSKLGGLDSISFFAPGSNGNVSPIATISGANTGLAGPQGIALDSNSGIYIANRANSVTLYAAGGNGNIAPTGALGSGVDNPAGIATDSHGNIFVAESNAGSNGSNHVGSIGIYPAFSNATVQPGVTLIGNTGLTSPGGVAVDPEGNVYVTDTSSGRVSIFAPGSNGAASPTTVISGPHTGLQSPIAIALDSSGFIYVADQNGFIIVFKKGSTGDAAPIATIGGSNTALNLPVGIALDTNANIYVANHNPFMNQLFSVTVYPAGSNGNVSPSSMISGDMTGLMFPTGIALDANGNIYVANDGSPSGGTDSISVYPAGSDGNVTPSATITGPTTALSAPFGLAIGP